MKRAILLFVEAFLDWLAPEAPVVANQGLITINDHDLAHDRDFVKAITDAVTAELARRASRRMV